MEGGGGGGGMKPPLPSSLPKLGGGSKGGGLSIGLPELKLSVSG